MLRESPVETEVLLFPRRSPSSSSANAAESTATSLVESERAWVGVTITKTSLTRPGIDTGFVWFWPDVMNYGRTPAHIVRVVVRPHQVPMGSDPTEPPILPTEPEYKSPESIGFEREGLIPPSSGITPIAVKITTTDYALLQQRKNACSSTGTWITRTFPSAPDSRGSAKFCGSLMARKTLTPEDSSRLVTPQPHTQNTNRQPEVTGQPTHAGILPPALGGACPPRPQSDFN
jgi:hypothetical protein